MANCSEHKNPLKHGGTSQSQRLLPGLDTTSFAKVDEKDFADWIVFSSEFAAYIKYYDTTNTATGNWQAFFSNDISAQLGNIAVQNIERYRTEVRERFDFIRDDDNATLLNDVKTKLNELFSALLTLSKALDEYVISLSEETSLKGTIQNLIQTKLASALKRLIAYQKAAKALTYLDLPIASSWVILNKQLTEADDLINNGDFSSNWLLETVETTWSNYVGTISADDSIFNSPMTAFADTYASIAHAANHNLFTSIFDTYLTSYSKIIQDAETELLKTLENYDKHLPHYALFLSFLKLFRFTQEHINTITQRHLDFYYREVLRLQPKAAEANRVHVLVELAKQVDEYLLAEGTGLKAGKDSLNNDISYALDADAVITKAKVSYLKTFYKASADDSIFVVGPPAKEQDNTGRVFASPITNSDDGLGAELSSTQKEWHPFVHKVYKDAVLDSIAMPKAQLGFVLASHYLYLSEGERKVSVRMVMSDNTALNGKNIECWLTTKKEWYQVESPTVSSTGKTLSDGLTACAEISFTIPGSAPAIVDYDAAVHGGTYTSVLPLLKIYIVNEDSEAYEYDALKDVTISKTEIKVDVGMDAGYNQKGLKNLLLLNDFGTLDASKPFLPFGGQPKKDSGLIIGHQEIFTKKKVSLSLNIEWADLSANANDISYNSTYTSTLDNNTHVYTYGKSDTADTPSCQPFFLESGVWEHEFENPTLNIGTKSIFQGASSKVQVPIISSGNAIPVNALYDSDSSSYEYKAESISGFMKLVLLKDFGYAKYLKDLSTYIAEASKSNYYPKAVGVEPVEPYTPKIKSLYVSYSAMCSVDLSDTNATNFNSREITFFHIHPFGEAEQHQYLQPSSDVYLLPQFKDQVSGTTEDHVGEFYIGIEKLEAGSAVNLLFQVLEGSTNPTVSKPSEHLRWFYLADNQWVALAASEYSDNTLQLVQSGIISFAIPKTATTTNTMLPTGYIWLMAAITQAPEAVCELLSVDAQAAVATFVNNNNADDFFDQALVAGSVSKLKSPDASIKKLTQPYPSFGGRPKESEEHFYIRVSERLRHKARAITIWDYEHLVLEAFPEIYKVKCLNHTRSDDGEYIETKPGYVTIITIPSLQNRNDANPLKPYTQQSTLTNIENFLREHSSCFAQIHASQPQFEEVRLEFTLRLHDEYKDFTFYSNMLKDEITQFLCPWAYGSGSSGSIDFGGKISKSVLINFIEERYYVDVITDVFMYVTVDELSLESADQEEITASTAKSILVSVPASKHVIYPFDEEDDAAAQECPEIEMMVNQQS